MKRVFFLILTTAIMAVAITSFNNCSSNSAQGRWEYKTISHYETSESQFNELGKSGWEYVDSFQSGGFQGSDMNVFKRGIP